VIGHNHVGRPLEPDAIKTRAEVKILKTLVLQRALSHGLRQGGWFLNHETGAPFIMARGFSRLIEGWQLRQAEHAPKLLPESFVSGYARSARQSRWLIPQKRDITNATPRHIPKHSSDPFRAHSET